MERALLLALLYFLGDCRGLQFSLERTDSPLPYMRATCGVLICVEESHTGINATSAEDDFSDPRSPIAKISSLKIFQVKSTPATSNNNGKIHNLLASVSSQHSRLTRVSNGVKADGRLEAGTATLRLELTKQNDCQAEYVCQSRAVDIEGRELWSTSHILQQPREIDDQKLGLNWASEPAMQLLSLAHQLNTKLAVVGSAVGSWEVEMNRFKDTIKYDINNLKSNLKSEGDRLEDKILSLGKDYDIQSDRLEDKVESLQKELNSKTSHLEDKVDAMNSHLESEKKSMLPGEGEITVQSGSCQTNLINSVQRQIRTEMLSLDSTMSSIKDNVAQIGVDLKHNVDASFSRIEQKLQTWEENDTQLFKSQTETPLCDRSRDFADMLSGQFASLENHIGQKFHEFTLTMNLTISEMNSFLEAQSSQGNVSVSAELTSTLTDLLKPKDCFKGMAFSGHFSSKNYAMLQPNRENKLAVPVLCDIFTDDGGWIVFQRRTTRNVNFYRGWNDYKHGFGSMDGDFWLGLDKIHAITKTGEFEFRVDLRYNGNSVFAHYDSFSVGDESSNYILHIAHYDGNAGDSLIAKHNGRQFSTHDKDNDLWPKNCAVEFVGAWWYNKCHDANLNGQWAAGSGRGLMWRPLTGDNSVSYSEMKIRRIL